jgi:apolipoprotein D and lipocalin family protein
MWRMTFVARACSALAAVLVLASSVSAAGFEPAKPVSPDLYSGRWYEIARTHNKLQLDCEGSTSDFTHWSAGKFSVVQTCHKGSATGPVRTLSASGQVLVPDNTKMKLGFLGGLISQEYWIVDHSDDGTWAIMARPDGRYVWLLSRNPVLDPGVKARALQRMSALGFDCSRLDFPLQGPS